MIAFLRYHEAIDVRVGELVESLDAPSIETREFAQSELLVIGPRAATALSRALSSSDPELRSRVEWLFCQPTFARTTEGIEVNLQGLGSLDRSRWRSALWSLVLAGDRAVAPLRRAAKEKDSLLSFRAAQVADILELQPVNGLKFGVVVEQRETSSDSFGSPCSSTPIRGVALFANVTSSPLSVETAFYSGMVQTSNDNPDIWLSRGRLLVSERSSIPPHGLVTKWREDLLAFQCEDGVIRSSLPGSGTHVLRALYCTERDDGPPCWTGSISGNSAVIKIHRRSEQKNSAFRTFGAAQ